MLTDYRSVYRRDADKILSSKAYSRYVDKTQVVYLVVNDHISHRAIHVQLVSSLARGIAEVLKLDCALVEAIALGHDVGHPPFGHEGEGYLSKISQKMGLGAFAHPWQSCRLLSILEPLELSLAVCDGMLCHDSGMSSPCIVPKTGKTWDDHRNDLDTKLHEPDVNLIPMSLEGCLVKICDTVSYLARDLEDAIQLGIIQRDQVPETLLGRESSTILRVFALDVLAQSQNQPHIAMSDRIYEAILTLRQFNFQNIYFDPRLKVQAEKINRGYQVLAHFLLEDLCANERDSFMWRHYLYDRSQEYVQGTSAERQVIDYIAGMTDGFFTRTLQKIFVPSAIGWSC